MRKYTETDIDNMLKKTEQTPPEGNFALPEQESPLPKRRIRAPLRIMAAVIAVAIIVCASLLPLLQNAPQPGDTSTPNTPPVSGDTSTTPVSGDTSTGEVSNPPVTQDIDEYLPQNQPTTELVSPWESGKLSLSSVTYKLTSSPVPAAARYYAAAVLLDSETKSNNISVTQEANTKRGQSDYPTLLDITYTATGEHKHCFGVYCDLETGEVICLQHKIFSAIDKQILIDIFARECKNILETDGSAEFDSYAELYDGARFSLAELGFEWASEYTGDELNELTEEVYLLIDRLRNNIYTKILEYGANRNYCIFRLCSCGASQQAKENESGNGNGIFLFDIKNNALYQLDLDTLAGFAGHISGLRANDDYTTVLYGSHNYENTSGYEIPSILRLNFNGSEPYSEQYEIDTKYLLAGNIGFSPTQTYACFPGYNQYETEASESKRWVFHNIALQSNVYLKGNFVRFALNDSIVIMENNSVYTAYETVTGNELDPSSVIGYERYVYSQKDDSLWRTDLFTGESRIVIEKTSAYSVCGNGAFIYSYDAETGSVCCVDMETSSRIEIPVESDFTAQANAAQSAKSVTYSLLTDINGEKAVLCYFTEDIYTLGDMYPETLAMARIGIQSAFSVEFSAVDLMGAFAFQLWDTAKTASGEPLNMNELTMRRIKYISAVLLADDLLDIYADRVLTEDEYQAFKEKYLQLIAEYIEVRSDGTVLICERPYVNKVGTGFLSENDFYAELQNREYGIEHKAEYSLENTMSSAISELTKTMDVDFAAVYGAITEFVTEKYVYRKTESGDIMFQPDSTAIHDVQKLAFKYCCALSAEPECNLFNKRAATAAFAEWVILHTGDESTELVVNDLVLDGESRTVLADALAQAQFTEGDEGTEFFGDVYIQYETQSDVFAGTGGTRYLLLRVYNDCIVIDDLRAEISAGLADRLNELFRK